MSSKLEGRRSLTADAAEAPVMASAAVRNWGIRTMVVEVPGWVVVVVVVVWDDVQSRVCFADLN